MNKNRKTKAHAYFALCASHNMELRRSKSYSPLSFALTVLLIATLLYAPVFAPTPEPAYADGVSVAEASVVPAPTSGASVYFGHYPKNDLGTIGAITTPEGVEGVDWVTRHAIDYYIGDRGIHYYDIEPIVWNVLENANGSLFLLATNTLDGKKYNETSVSITWEKSTLRSWLNGLNASSNANAIDYTSDNFIGKAFTAGERDAINTTELKNPDNTTHGIPGGNDTRDKVFCLSIPEVAISNYGFNPLLDKDDTVRSAKATDYAKTNKTVQSIPSPGNCDWWLRSPGGYHTSYAAIVYAGGTVHITGYEIVDIISVRPALKINLNAVVFMENDGKTIAVPKSEIRPAITTPAAPQNFTITPGDGQVVLSWAAPASDGGSPITKYQVQKDNDAWIDLAPTITSYTYTGLTNGTEYTFRVRAVNAAGGDSGAGAGEGAEESAVIVLDAFVAVTDITDVPASATAGVPLTLSGTVTPQNATNKTLAWSLKNAGETGAMINGDIFTAGAAGTATVTATIANGASVNTAFTKDFTITVAKSSETGVTKSATAVKVTLNANGGKVSGKAKLVKSVKQGAKLGKLKVPTRKGYAFQGWYTKKSGGKKISANTKAPAKKVIYYAHWKKTAPKKKVRYGQVVATAVYVRKSPSRHVNLVPVVGHLKRGQTFKIQAFIDNPGTRNDWYAFKYKGKTRYVYAKYIKIARR